jgi:hypothetical protein
MNLVYRHKSGGELWQGDMDDVRTLANDHNNRIKTIGLFAIEFQPDIRSGRYEVLKHGFNDISWLSDREVQAVIKLVDEVSSKLATRVRKGSNVLSTCAAGWNRSGIMSALTLMKVSGLDPDTVIKMIRDARGPNALSNHTFVKIIYAMADCSGAHAAWTQWTGGRAVG